MRLEPPPTVPTDTLAFRGGTAGAVLPFVAFLTGVAWLALSGAPDERGFWPVLLGSLALGLGLARDRERYAEAILAGMSRPIVMVMILAWVLAGVLAVLMNATGFVPALVAVASAAGFTGAGTVVTAFLIACVVSTATGTSLGTLLLCGPLLYPIGSSLGADPAWLMGAILAGATFGDNLSPISDTTIASATSQGADLGGVVRSRLRYALPAAAASLVGFALLGGAGGGGPVATPDPVPLRPLAMLLAPAVALAVLLRRRGLLEGLFAGIATAIALGLALGLVAPSQLLFVDHERFLARGLLLEGMERAVGISVFTILLMGLVSGLEASGLLGRWVAAAEARARGRRGAERWIFAVMSAATVVTTHSVVAILAVGPFARATGARFGVGRYRRANLLDVTSCTWPFLLPWCIPTILAASLTAAGAEAGMPRLDPLTVGLHNLHSWGLLALVLLAVGFGYGGDDGEREAASPSDPAPTGPTLESPPKEMLP